MAEMKCKMCGGDLNVKKGELVAECEYCGSKQTIPRLDNDRKANLYERANHFRRINEYDKASGLFEQVLNEDATDAEAYWSLVLCKYGIEYVEDPTSHRRIPTVNRVQFTSVSADDDYKLALQYADDEQREIYEEEAKEIDSIQRGILDISSKEEPFDIFICYKETDDKGRRTPDSVLANEIYYQLLEEGYKVFFSRITLEDKLGTAYEPYIFAALNSARVMIVVGTKAEYFNSVWVKNEWNRYLALIRKGAKKTLIPAYRDMDPYDLPDEFSHLQAQDMSKLGFMQDLIRGVKKIAPVNNNESADERDSSSTEEERKISRSVKQMFLYLEEKDWNGATRTCEEVLKEDPGNAEAYLGRLMLDLRVPLRSELEYYPDAFDDNINYIRAIRFADRKLKEELEKYALDVKKRITNVENEKVYKSACLTMQSAKFEEDFLKAADEFASISDYKDANELRDKCVVAGEEVRKGQIYKSAKEYQNKNTPDSLKRASDLYRSISGYKDAEDLAVISQDEANNLLYEEEKARLEEEQRKEKARLEEEQKKEKARLEEEQRKEKARRKKDNHDFIFKNWALWFSILFMIMALVMEATGNITNATRYATWMCIFLIIGTVRFYPSVFRENNRTVCISINTIAVLLGIIMSVIDESGQGIVFFSVISLIIALRKKYTKKPSHNIEMKKDVPIVHPPKSATEYIGTNYEDAKKELMSCGFKNIKTVGNKDLIFGGKKKEGKITSISIRQVKEFSKGNKFRADDLVLIHYHSRA